MALGDSNDIVAKIKRLIPNRWFAYVAPYRDAILGGIADSAAWCYKLIFYARAQTRLATAYGIWLDILSQDFLGRYLPRNSSNDDVFRATIKATILQERVTRLGMNNAITALGATCWIFEPWNTFDTGAYSGVGQKYGSMGYGVGRGGYGSMALPSQTLMVVQRGLPGGVPIIGGYNGNEGGYGVGGLAWVASESLQIGITNAIIEKQINITKPTGSIVWLRFDKLPKGIARRPMQFKASNNSQNIAIV